MPGLDGLGVMRELQAAKSATRTLVVTARMDSGSVRAALALGAAGYLPKNESGSELLLAIRRVAQGRRYISADIASLFVDDAESQNTEHKLGIRNSAEMAAYAIRTQSGTTTPGEL